MTVELFYLTLSSLVEQEDIAQIVHLRNIMDTLEFDRVNIAFGVSYSLADIIIRLFTDSENFAANKDLFNANVIAMHEFTQRTPPAKYIFGGWYDNFTANLLPAAEAWQAAHPE